MPAMALHKAMWAQRAKTFSLWFLALLVATSIGVLVAAKPAHAATFTVNRTGDAPDANLANAACDVNTSLSGNQCTLRAAIQEANDTLGADEIRFNIVSTASVKTIAPTSALPIITEQVTIDGYTQTGASANTLATGNDAVLKVQLNGINAGTDTSGLEIRAPNSTIRGLVINRFSAHGVIIRGSGAEDNNVEGNFIGTNPAGTADRGNAGAGVVIAFASNNAIGGTQPAQRNLLSGNGNGFGGVHITGAGATGNNILGNFIGTTADGTGDLGNGGDGVLIQSADNTVGGTASGARNLISGNGGDGVLISGSEATLNTVEGNRIGTTADGTGDLGNDVDGVHIASAPDNTIGGTTSGARNLISGNQDDGVEIRDGALGNEVLGNFIGTTVSGNAALGNSGDGVDISDADDNTIGGTSAAARNIISGNFGDGVVIFTPSTNNEATGNKVQGNFIGTGANGTTPLGNDDGVAISSGSDSTIGSAIGSTAGGNRIAHNDQDGVLVFGGLAVGNRILSNSIHSNGETGIDLGGGTEDSFGVTANDGDNPATPQIDPDSDAPSSNNHRQNFPVITTAVRSSSTGNTTITGTINSNPQQFFTIQCFVAAPDPSGHGEGRTFLVQTTTTTNANGNGNFVCITPGAKAGQAVTATATNTSGTASGTSIGDTSEFSLNRTIISGS